MFSNKKIRTLIFLVFICTLSCGGPSNETEAAETTQLKDSHNLNPAFWDYAVSSNLLQVELGRLAAEKGTTQQVKDWGIKAEKFHKRALQQLRALGSGHDAILLPDSLGSADKKMVQDFSLLQGADFDARYRDHLLISHKAQLSRYEEALQKAGGPKLKNWLLNMQEHMREQLQIVEQADSLQTTKTPL